jgi:hypothetical protein
MNFRANISQLKKDGHNNKLNESSLATCDVGGSPIAHHRDIKLLSFLHITLVEEFIEQQISPLGTNFIRS